MQESQLWELFEKTGNIGVYILYKKAQEDSKNSEGNETTEDAASDRWSRNSGDKLG